MPVSSLSPPLQNAAFSVRPPSIWGFEGFLYQVNVLDACPQPPMPQDHQSTRHDD